MWAHDEYLNRLTADSEARASVASAEQFLRETLGDVSFDSIFIGNANPAPTGPRFGGLWYFTDAFRIVVGNFLRQPQYVVGRAGPLEGITIVTNDWERGQPTAESVMAIQFTDPFHLGGGLTARGENCTQLHDVLKRYLLPKLRLT